MKLELKYAPQTLADVIYPSAVIEQQIADIGSGALRDDLLLYGPHGTAKSTTARLISYARHKQMPNSQTYIAGSRMENAAAAKKIMEDFEGQYKFLPFFSGFDVIIVDEIDMVHMSAQHRFREAMQDLGNTTQFVFTTNHYKDVYTGIRDACRTIEFPLPSAHQWLPRAQYILTAEGVSLSDGKVLNILAESNGSVRDTCRLLQDAILAHRRLHEAAPQVTLQPPLLPPTTTA